jgi:hypothetical protein
VGLTPEDPDKEKTFENSTEGMVKRGLFQHKEHNLGPFPPPPPKKNTLFELQNIFYLVHSALAAYIKILQHLMGKWK